MSSRPNRFPIFAICVTAFLPNAIAAASEFSFECGPACGHVCKLVCETKKLTAVCYACECDEICIPGPSRRGCKHCATCGGEFPDCGCDLAYSGCQGHTPQCEFCWRDWCACGCAQPRTVKVLTKYEAEKEIAWYHWEVVDAASCGCVAKSGKPATNRCVYKPAPMDAQLGDILPVSDEEWSELASILGPAEKDASSQFAGQPASPTADDSIAPDAKPERLPIAERLGRLFKR